MQIIFKIFPYWIPKFQVIGQIAVCFAQSENNLELQES